MAHLTSISDQQSRLTAGRIGHHVRGVCRSSSSTAQHVLWILDAAKIRFNHSRSLWVSVLCTVVDPVFLEHEVTGMGMSGGASF